MAEQTLVERLARALWADRNPDDPPWPSELDRKNYQGHARAVLAEIEAMGLVVVPRKPSERMVHVARDPRTANGSPVSKGVRDTWAAMVKAALAERDTKKEAGRPEGQPA